MLNTEFEKLQSPKTDGDDNFNDDEKINEERLTDELVNLKVNELMKYAKSTSLC